MQILPFQNAINTEVINVILYFLHTIQDSVCILHLRYISVWMSHTASAHELLVANGCRAG